MATVPLLEDDEFGNDDFQDKNKLSHPYVTFFHIFFRGAAIAVYMFCGLFTNSFITSFVFVVLLLSADFWTVKNITGRILVGLRWWNYIDDEGKSHWVYESRNNTSSMNKNNPREVRFFWFGLTVCPGLWGLFFIGAVFGFKFKWLVLVLIALALNLSNLYGYIKCNFGANRDIKEATSDFVKGQMFKNAVNILQSQSNPPNPTRATGIV